MCHSPGVGWTDRNDSDPGVTLVALLAFLAAGLLFAYGLHLARRRRTPVRDDD